MCLLQPHSCFFATREFELYLHKITIEPMTRVYLIPIILVLLLAVGCHRADDRLVGLDAISDSAPQAVLDSLACIDRATLTEADRHYYDFLSVKAADKAYITHSSDSLILSVVDYASNHQSHGYYPEALYYCGRVYSDLGDYPTALTYFHQALDQLPEVAANRKLRGNIISQTGRLLNTLRLYNQAITYLENVISNDIQTQDSINLIYDLQLLGHTYLKNNDKILAEKCFIEALNRSRGYDSTLVASSRMFLAEAKYEQGDVNSALNHYRMVNGYIDSISSNTYYLFGARIYSKAGILDTAYQYCQEIINSKKQLHREIGYSIILSPKLRNFLPKDSIEKYFNDYAYLLEKYFDANQNQLAINQQAMYNYKLHDEARVKAEKKAQSIRYWLIAVGIALLFTVIIILYLKNRNQKNLIQLHIALETIDKLKNNIDSKSEDPNLDVNAIRDKLRASIEVLKDNANIKVPSSILQSRVYSTLQDYIYQKKGIPDNSNLWADLENEVLACSPNFKKYIQMLSNGNISSADYRTALLIKCNISPTNMSYLFQLTRTTINSRRTSISKKLFGESMSSKLGDALIRSL